MNVKPKTIIISVICAIVLVITSVLSGTTIYYKHKYTKSVECYRQLVEQSRKRNEQYDQLYRAARTTNNDIRESLQRCQCSLDELRAALLVIRTRYEEMENLLSCIWNNDDNSDSSGSTNNSDNAQTLAF